MFRPLIRPTKINLKPMWRSLTSYSSQFSARNSSELSKLRLIGCSTGILGFTGFMSRSSLILNDVQPAARPIEQISTNVQKIGVPQSNTKKKYLNYQELTAGSIAGLFLGVVAGKLSSIIVFLTLSSYLLLQFLESRGIATVPWKKMVTVGSESVDVKTLLFERPSFKLPFILSFLIAAYNI